MAMADVPVCRLCQTGIDTEEEYVEATCNGCGHCVFHKECLTPLLEKLKHDSTRAMERARRMAALRPAYYMAEQRMKCPSGRKPDGTECGGRIVDADMVKPVKTVPAPVLPPPPPGLGPKNKKKSGAGGVSASTRKQAPVPAAAPSKRQQREQLRAAAAAVRSAEGLPPLGSPAGDGGRPAGGARAGSGGGPGGSVRGSKLKFPPMQRPVDLQRCADFDELGECFIHRCPRCHGDEELAERERQWVARQEAKKREKRQEELAKHDAALAQRAEQAEWEEQVVAREQERLMHEEAYLEMQEAPLRLMKEHKRSSCVAQLVDMGFAAAQASAAADASGCDVSAAAALLMEGALLMGSKPVSVTGEAQELLAYAGSLGLSLADVEMAVLIAKGDWDEAREQLHQQAEAAATAASAAEAAAAAQSAATASSREEAELAAALRASSSAAAAAYTTAQQATATAASAREEAELAAALEASRAEDEARRQLQRYQEQSPVLPWASSGRAGVADAAVGWGAAGAAGAAAQPPTVQFREHQQQQAGSSVQPLWYYNERATSSMPQYGGGWDVGVAAVASVRSTSALAGGALQPSLFAEHQQQQQQQQSPSLVAQLTAGPGQHLSPGSTAASLGPSGSPAGVTLPQGWGSPPVLPFAQPLPGLQAARAAGHGQQAATASQAAHNGFAVGALPAGKVQQQLLAPATPQHAASDESAEIDELMSLMGLSG